jgi:hypothetical protein
MPAKRSLLSAIAVLIAVAATLPAAAAQSGKAKTVTPKQFAAEVCPDLAFFVKAYQEVAQAVSGSSSASEAQGVLIFAIDDVSIAARDLVATVRYAGTPDWKNGKRSVALLIREFKRIRTALDDASGDVAGLDSDDPEQFANDLATIERTTDEKLDASFDRLDAVDPKLQKALEANEECASL